jgi:hypothetical protein
MYDMQNAVPWDRTTIASEYSHRLDLVRLDCHMDHEEELQFLEECTAADKSSPMYNASRHTEMVSLV